MTTSFRKILFIKWHKTHRLTYIKIRVSDIYPTFTGENFTIYFGFHLSQHTIKY